MCINFEFHPQVPYPIIIPIKKPQYQHHHGHHDTHSHHHLSSYDHHTDFTNNKYQQVAAQRPQSSEQSSSSTSSSGEFQEFPHRPEHLRETPSSSQQEQTKLFSPSNSESIYNQQQQLRHQQHYAQLRRELLTRERMRSSSDESEAESTEFRPIVRGQSDEYMSPSSNVETVVPPPPNQQTQSTFHINVPNENELPKESTSNSGQVNNHFTHNIEIPVHFYRLQPLENGEGFAITS